MNALPVQAIKKANQIRTKLKLNIFEPINVFDACNQLEVSVRFIDISMEGMYVSISDASSPVILISSLRPLPRRVFTCAHELGHHLFGHGSKIDGLNEDGSKMASYDKEEYLVDVFAGALLMPIAGVEREFKIRKWTPENCTSLQFYTVSSMFGTGYSTMVKHCRAHKIITDSKATELLRDSPGKILRGIAGEAVESAYFRIIDANSVLPTIDLEVGGYLFFPPYVTIEGDHLLKVKNTDIGDMFIAKRPGICRAVSTLNSTGSFVRVQNNNYVGLAENRHLQDNVD
ncbi:ImmA/IrrE family metallo-endopeptidase [Dyadobacter sp. OTU695]|uniref:ImmA/IrrE family metallo-endopeptidase n=1 Tax=Dyadobacter sp. OTU695 TaxID=3043860 RepID=UPI00313D81F6